MAMDTSDAIASLTQQVAELSREVHFLKSRLDAQQSDNGSPAVVDALIVNDVLAFTRSLFEGEVQIAEREDPEYPDDRYAMLYARTALPEDEIGRRQREWHKSLRNVAKGRQGYFRLCVEVQ